MHRPGRGQRRPHPGRPPHERWFAAVVIGEGHHFRLVPTRANGQPAFGVCLRSPLTGRPHVFDLVVITLAGHRVSAITRFEHGVTGRFGFPRTLTE